MTSESTLFCHQSVSNEQLNQYKRKQYLNVCLCILINLMESIAICYRNITRNSSKLLYPWQNYKLLSLLGYVTLR